MPDQEHHGPRERLVEKPCFIDHFVTQRCAQQIHKHRAKPDQTAHQHRELIYPRRAGRIGHLALSPYELRRSTSNRNTLIRAIFAQLQGRYAIGHPTVIKFSFTLLGENKNVGHMTSIGGNNFYRDLCLIVFLFRSDNRRRGVVQHRRIRRAPHDLHKFFQWSSHLLVGRRCETEHAFDSSVRFWVIIMLKRADLVLDDLFRGQVRPRREIGKLSHSHVR